MRGVTLIEFMDVGDGGAVAGTSDLVPADWVVSANGKSITISKATMLAKGAAWYNPGDTDRNLRLNMVSGPQATTTAITSAP